MDSLAPHSRPARQPHEPTSYFEPPPCYGSGEVRVPVPGYEQSAFNYVTVHPHTCFRCPVERRCLAQQRRRR